MPRNTRVSPEITPCTGPLSVVTRAESVPPPVPPVSPVLPVVLLLEVPAPPEPPVLSGLSPQALDAHTAVTRRGRKPARRAIRRMRPPYHGGARAESPRRRAARGSGKIDRGRSEKT